MDVPRPGLFGSPPFSGSGAGASSGSAANSELVRLAEKYFDTKTAQYAASRTTEAILDAHTFTHVSDPGASSPPSGGTGGGSTVNSIKTGFASMAGQYAGSKIGSWFGNTTGYLTCWATPSGPDSLIKSIEDCREKHRAGGSWVGGIVGSAAASSLVGNS